MTDISLKRVLNKILRTLIVETGSTSTTNGRPCTWTWRKWADGTVECWGYTDAATYSLSNVSGYGYYISESVYFPNNLFTSVETVMTNRKQGTGATPNHALITISANNVTTQLCTYWVFCTSQTTQSAAIMIYAKGKWK